MAKAKLKLEIKKQRVFSKEFKRKKVQELVAKRITVLKLSREYSVSRSSVYKWLYTYSVHYRQNTKLVVQMESEESRTKYYRDRNAELERVVGQKQLEIDFLNKLVEIASQEMGFDIKKNFSTQLSSGTDNTDPSTTTK